MQKLEEKQASLSPIGSYQLNLLITSISYLSFILHFSIHFSVSLKMMMTPMILRRVFFHIPSASNQRYTLY